MTPPTLAEIAKRIHAHLQRFEADPAINYDYVDEMKHKRYFHAGAWRAGRYVGVRYISFQGEFNLTKKEAERYLEKLDAGFVGRHFEALREERS